MIWSRKAHFSVVRFSIDRGRKIYRRRRREGAKSGEHHSLSTREPIGCVCTNRHALSSAPLFFSGDWLKTKKKNIFVFFRKFGSRVAKNSLFLRKKDSRLLLLCPHSTFFCSSTSPPPPCPRSFFFLQFFSTTKSS